jgi:cytochrome oxidase Cu insertion factor (SCO1/SenC/PrrC family)
MRVLRLVVVAALMAAVLPAVAPVAAAAAPDFAAMKIERYDPPKVAPAFTLPGLDGTPVHLADLKGKVVLLFYWATW